MRNHFKRDLKETSLKRKKDIAIVYLPENDEKNIRHKKSVKKRTKDEEQEDDRDTTDSEGNVLLAGFRNDIINIQRFI